MATTTQQQAPPIEPIAYTSGHSNLSASAAHELAMMQPQPQLHQQPATSQLYYQNNPIYHRHHHQYPPGEPATQASTASTSGYYLDSSSQFMQHPQQQHTTSNYTVSQAAGTGYCVSAIDPSQDHYMATSSQIGLSSLQEPLAPASTCQQEPLDGENQLPGFESHYFAPPPVPSNHQQQPETGVFFQMTGAAGSQATGRHADPATQFQPWISPASSCTATAYAQLVGPTVGPPPHHSDVPEAPRNRQLCGSGAAPPIYHPPSNGARHTSTSDNQQSAIITAPQVHASTDLKALAAGGTCSKLKTHQRPHNQQQQLGFGVTARRKNATRETTANLKSWLEEHGHNPYPSKGEKIMLAMVTRLSMTQVSTWFANARRRMKKENKMLSWAIQRPPATSSSTTTSTTRLVEESSKAPVHPGEHPQHHSQSSRSRALKYLMNRHYLGSPGLAALSPFNSAPKRDHHNQQQQVSSCQPFGGELPTSGGNASRPEKVVRQAQSSGIEALGGSRNSTGAEQARTCLRAPKWNTARHRKRALRASVTDSGDGAPSTTTAAC